MYDKPYSENSIFNPYAQLELLSCLDMLQWPENSCSSFLNIGGTNMLDRSLLTNHHNVTVFITAHRCDPEVGLLLGKKKEISWIQVWIPRIPENERDCYLEVSLESQTNSHQPKPPINH